MSNELIVIDQINALQVFANENGLDPVIEQIRKQVKSEVYDISTKEGRERIGSIARKIGSAKIALKNMSKELTEDWQRQTKAVTSEATRMESELDALRDEIKAPLDEYNNIEKTRIADHESNLDAIREAAIFEYEPTIEQVQDRIQQVNALGSGDFEEFAERADGRIAYSEKILNEKLATLKKQEAEKAELEKLRAEKEAKEQQERENKLKADAADSARREAEAKAQREAAETKAKSDAEKQKIQDQKDAAIKKAKDAEDAKKAALKEAEEAEARARQKLEDEKQAEIAEAAKREANKKHKAKINGEILTVINEEMSLDGTEENLLKDFLNLVARGRIPHVKISY